MNKQEEIDEMCDTFLSEVVSILELGDFKFSKETLKSNVYISNEAEKKLIELCFKDAYKRLDYNKENYLIMPILNVNWAFNVIKEYFNLDLLEGCKL